MYTPTAVVGVRGTAYELGIADDGSVAVNVNDGGVAVNNGQSENWLTNHRCMAICTQEELRVKNEHLLHHGYFSRNGVAAVINTPSLDSGVDRHQLRCDFC